MKTTVVTPVMPPRTNIQHGLTLARRLVTTLVTTLALTVVCLVGLIAPWNAPATAANLSPAPETAKVYIIAPENNTTVASPFLVQFGLSGMGIAPAGVDRPNTGHHHLLIDVNQLPALTEPLQGSQQLLHYGAGQTETELSLPAGTHTLQLVLGNYTHIPHEPSVISDKITITVQ